MKRKNVERMRHAPVSLHANTASAAYVNSESIPPRFEDSAGSVTSEDGTPLTTKDLLCYAYQIARGMEYLDSRKVLSQQSILVLESQCLSFHAHPILVFYSV